MCFLIKLKILKSWLSFLPLVGILVIVLHVQSNKNQEEFEAQYVKSTSTIEEDIKRTLPNFYSRMETFFIRKGYAEFAKAAFPERDIISLKDYDDLMQKQLFKKAYLYNLWTELNFDEKMACYFFAQEGFLTLHEKIRSSNWPKEASSPLLKSSQKQRETEMSGICSAQFSRNISWIVLQMKKSKAFKILKK